MYTVHKIFLITKPFYNRSFDNEDIPPHQSHRRVVADPTMRPADGFQMDIGNFV